MKKRFFAGIAAVVLTLSACTLHAGAVFAQVTSEPWNGWKELDDKGMLQFYSRQADWQWSIGDYSVFLRTKETDGVDSVYVVGKLKYEYAFVLKPGLDADAAVTEILQQYYDSEYESASGQAALYDISVKNRETDSGMLWQIRDNTEDQAAKNADAVKQELTAAGLISQFYEIGQTGWLYEPYCYYPTAYLAASPAVDPEKIQEYIDTMGLDCTLQYCESIAPNGLALEEAAYCVVPNEEISYEKHFELAADIYEALGIYTWLWLDPNAKGKPYVYGQNALEYPGDLNIDGTADVSDAVLLARVIAEDDNMPAICDTGYLNADVDGDGLLTILDVTALLETFVN